MIKKILIVHHQTSLPEIYWNFEYESEIDSVVVSGVFEAISSVGT
jgi:hypothetical protein